MDDIRPKVPKTVIAIAIPVAMLCGFVSVLVRGIARAFYHAWLEARIELASGRNEWRR